MAEESESRDRKSPFLIVGLGNPGPEYLWTPHNAGFMAIDRIAQQEGVGREVVLAKPETFMNLSGIAVAALVQEFEADPAKDLLVIHDELDLTLGTFKIRERGSPAGHNGARSVTGALGSQEWLRLRIGVGLDLPPEALAAGGGRRPGRDYLLSPMRKADLTVLDEVLDRVATATRRILEQGVENSQRADQRGDQIVTVEVVVPHLQDERSREIMRELAKLNNQDPRVALFEKGRE